MLELQKKIYSYFAWIDCTSFASIKIASCNYTDERLVIGVPSLLLNILPCTNWVTLYLQFHKIETFFYNDSFILLFCSFISYWLISSVKRQSIYRAWTANYWSSHSNDTSSNQTILLNNNRRFVKERENIPSYNRTNFEWAPFIFTNKWLLYTLSVYYKDTWLTAVHCLTNRDRLHIFFFPSLLFHIVKRHSLYCIHFSLHSHLPSPKTTFSVTTLDIKCDTYPRD